MFRQLLGLILNPLPSPKGKSFDTFLSVFGDFFRLLPLKGLFLVFDLFFKLLVDCLLSLKDFRLSFCYSISNLSTLLYCYLISSERSKSSFLWYVKLSLLSPYFPFNSSSLYLLIIRHSYNLTSSKAKIPFVFFLSRLF